MWEENDKRNICKVWGNMKWWKKLQTEFNFHQSKSGLVLETGLILQDVQEENIAHKKKLEREGEKNREYVCVKFC